MLAKTPTLKKEASRKGASSLLPPATGGKLFISGYHRTSCEKAAASIVIETIKLGKSGIYGPGFYMTRSYLRQGTSRMIRSYGEHLVRCRVDISQFICFDEAHAKRVWGNKYTLSDQLKAFGPWDPQQDTLIKAQSKNLSNLWKDKNKNVKKRRFSSDVAMAIRMSLVGFISRVPGIIYTGSQDGACVLAYHADRVTPLSTAYVPKREKADKVIWFLAQDKSLQRRFNPSQSLRDDIQTYRHALICKERSAAEKIKHIETAYAGLPDDGHERLAFVLALLKIGAPNLQEMRDRIVNEEMEKVCAFLQLELPYYTNKHQKIGGTDYYSEGYGKRNRESLKGYSSVLAKEDLFWSYVQNWLLMMVSAHHAILFKNTTDTLVQSYKGEPVLKDITAPILHIFYHKRGVDGCAFVSSDKYYYRRGQFNDGVKTLLEFIEGNRNERLQKRYRPGNQDVCYPRKVWEKNNAYEKHLKTQWLDFYFQLKKHPQLKTNLPLKKALALWWYELGKSYVKDIA